MYDPRVIPKDTFKVLLLYLQGLRVVFHISLLFVGTEQD